MVYHRKEKNKKREVFVMPKMTVVSENINAKGYNYAECIEQEKCTACKMCYITCPDVAITIEK